jgi:uncharacterized protein (DUF58 family)
VNLSSLSIAILALIGVAGIAQQWTEPDTLPWWRYLSAMLVAGLVYEWFSTRATGLQVSAAQDYSLRLGRSEQVNFSIGNEGVRARSVEFTPALPVELEGAEETHRLDIAPLAQHAIDLRLRGSEIGRFQWSRLPARVKGPLGLGWWPIRLTMDCEFAVVPDLLSARHRAEGDVILGERPARPGAGLELDRLRDYERGDPLRSIDWKATARGQKLITRVFRDEQHLEILLVIDAGRTSRTRVDGMSQLGHYINLAAQFAQFAMANGDEVGLVAVADKPLLAIPAGRGSRGMTTINRALRTLQSKPAETDMLGAALQVQQLARGRCLVIVVTDLYGQSLEGNFGRSLRLWKSRHLPFVASMIGSDVSALAAEKSEAPIDPFTSLATAEYRDTVLANAEAARRLGARAIVTRPSELQTRVISEYRLLKRQRRV